MFPVPLKGIDHHILLEFILDGFLCFSSICNILHIPKSIRLTGRKIETHLGTAVAANMPQAVREVHLCSFNLP